MPSFYPIPYKDELLYSTIARYHIRAGNISPKSTLEELFGCRDLFAVTDLPCRIKDLAQRIKKLSGLNEKDIILKHTLYPYYTVFQSWNKSNSTYKNMLSCNGKKVHMELGIMASTIKQPEYLRFCPGCMKEDYDLYGETYWHRLHQIPGYFVCSKHGILLFNSSVKYCGDRKNEFFTASKDTCLVEPTKISLSEKEFNTALSISMDIEYIFNEYDTISQFYINNNGFKDLFTSILVENGFATKSHRVYQEELISAFIECYGESLLSIYNSNLSTDIRDCWLSMIVRKHRKAFHPIRHILMARFLKGSLKEFIEAFNANEKPIGIRKSKRCSEIMESLKSLKVPGNDEILIEEYRTEWLNEKCKNPSLSRTELRKLIPRVFTWLYRHDRGWLIANYPEKAEIPVINNRVDWKQRDSEMLDLVKKAVRAILDRDGKPIRITVSTLGKSVNRLSLVEKKLDKLPKTKKYILSVAESEHHFRIRKIEWAKDEIRRDGRLLTDWEVLRKAGIRCEFWNDYRKYVEMVAGLDMDVKKHSRIL